MCEQGIADSRLCHRWATPDVHLLIFISKQNSVKYDAVVSAVTLLPLRNHMTHGRTIE